MAHTKLQTYYIIVPFTIITEIQFPLKKTINEKQKIQ